MKIKFALCIDNPPRKFGGNPTQKTRTENLRGAVTSLMRECTQYLYF